jgi:hypothetical protein
MKAHNYWKQDIEPKTVGERVALDLIEMTWTPAPEGACESHRGTYSTRIRCTEFKISPPGGWHAMEHAHRMAREAYQVIADAIDAAIPDKK